MQDYVAMEHVCARAVIFSASMIEFRRCVLTRVQVRGALAELRVLDSQGRPRLLDTPASAESSKASQEALGQDARQRSRGGSSRAPALPAEAAEPVPHPATARAQAEPAEQRAPEAARGLGHAADPHEAGRAEGQEDSEALAAYASYATAAARYDGQARLAVARGLAGQEAQGGGGRRRVRHPLARLLAHARGAGVPVPGRAQAARGGRGRVRRVRRGGSNEMKVFIQSERAGVA